MRPFRIWLFFDPIFFCQQVNPQISYCKKSTPYTRQRISRTVFWLPTNTARLYAIVEMTIMIFTGPKMHILTQLHIFLMIPLSQDKQKYATLKGIKATSLYIHQSNFCPLIVSFSFHSSLCEQYPTVYFWPIRKGYLLRLWLIASPQTQSTITFS